MSGKDKKIELLDLIEKQGVSDNDTAVLKKLSKSFSREVRMYVAEILAQNKIAGGDEILRRLCNDKNHLVRAEACNSIAIYDNPSCYEQLMERISDKNDLVISCAIGSAAIWALEFSPDKKEELLFKLNSLSNLNPVYSPALHCAKYALGDITMKDCIKKDLNSLDPYVQSRTIHNLDLLKSHCDTSVFSCDMVNLALESRTVFVKNAAEEFLNR